LILSAYGADALHRAFGIDMSTIGLGPIEEAGVGGSWGRVAPGRGSDPHQHDEIETFVIVAGAGDLVVDKKRYPVASGTVIQFEPFETHFLENTGEDDLLFATFYWRNPDRAARAAVRTDRRRFDERPIFAFSTPPTPNGDLHLGHLSGPYLGTDVFVRFQRMNGANAWHLAATDDFQPRAPGDGRALQRRDRGHPQADGHRDPPVQQDQRRRDLSRRPAGVLLPRRRVRTGHPTVRTGALRRRDRPVPL
jgi:methionyl-tRNA synthetase